MRYWLFVVFFCMCSADIFTENLTISRLPLGNILSHFKFHITGDLSSSGSEFSLFPRVIAELLSHYSIQELSLSLGMGRWSNTEWGIPPQPNAPTGAYLHAWIEGNDTNIDEKWKRIVNSLNGILCTSLTSVIPTLTSSPLYLSKSTLGYNSNAKFRYAALPREIVCTENLTPWRKLLPCKQSGLVTLLNPLKLYDSNFHSIALNVYRENENSNWILNLDLILVSPGSSFQESEIDIERIFGRKVVGKCKASNESFVIIQNSSNNQASKNSQKLKDYTKYDLKNDDSQNNPHIELPLSSTNAAFINVVSQIGGVGDYSGKMVTKLTNSNAGFHRVTYIHEIPWFVKIHFHSLQLYCENNGHKMKPEILGQSFTPAISRDRPALIEYNFYFPNDSHCFVEFEFKKAFLRLREYPPDANHGMYVPSVILVVENGSDLNTFEYEERKRVVIHGNILLIVLPVPDFSMPFNVICFVLTTITLCFGPIHNFSTKILLPLNSKLPMPNKYRKIMRLFLLLLLGLAMYAQFYEIGLNELRRIIVRAVENLRDSFEKMNNL